MTETDTSRWNVVDFKRRDINEWPKRLYIADFGDGDGVRPYASIQHPDDTTPEYVRADLHMALLARAEKAEAERDTAWNDAIEAAIEAVAEADSKELTLHGAAAILLRVGSLLKGEMM